MSPRAGRRPVPPGKAMKSIYFDENHKVDEAGAALIKAVGIYSPGSYVRLQSDEVAIVVRRGANTTTPLAAVILNRKGMPQAELTVRDTVQPEFKVIASIPYDGVRVKPNLKRLLPLTLRNTPAGAAAAWHSGMKLAIVGSGISGLAVAHRLRGQADITLFEAGDYFGGHTHTVDLTLNQAGKRVTHGIDTGFLVFNERTYPELIRLFAELGVSTARSDMSFSAQVMGQPGRASLEWSGSSLNTVFAQRRNLVRPRFLGMLADVLRFNRLANALALGNQDAELM
eukprot:gene47489-63666_t